MKRRKRFSFQSNGEYATHESAALKMNGDSIVLRLPCTHPNADLRKKADKPQEHRIRITKNGAIRFLDHAGCSIQAMELQVKALHDKKKIRGCFLVAHLMYCAFIRGCRKDPTMWECPQSEARDALNGLGKRRSRVGILGESPFYLTKDALEDIPTVTLCILKRMLQVTVLRHRRRRGTSDRYAKPLQENFSDRMGAMKRVYVDTLMGKIERVGLRIRERKNGAHTIVTREESKEERIRQERLARIWG